VTSAAPFLEMRNIWKSFPGLVALDNARLDVQAGEVMALMGANGAGKSTLMNVLGGVVQSDRGEITVGGQPLSPRKPADSLHAGIAFVHQELNSLPTMTIAENIFIDEFPQRWGRIDHSTCARVSRELLSRLGSELDPTVKVSDLSIGDRQLVEIARALRRNPRVLIFDEPTSSLSGNERERLFDVIRALKNDGVAVIYITHFIDEIFSISDRVTIMRNGTTVFSGATSALTGQDVVHHMLGARENERPLQSARSAAGEPLLIADRLTRFGVLSEVSFSLRAGEVVGLWGLLGSGRTELLRALAGLDPIDSGSLQWAEAEEMKAISPTKVRTKAGFVTEDRRGEGLFLPLSASDNIVMTKLGAIASFGLIRRQIQRQLADQMIQRLGIKTSSRDQRVSTLSGGNQQKVVFARWLATSPRLLLLDEPTRGLDVGAKTEILRLVREVADAGAAVLLVSSELEELTRVCNRYLIMVRGSIVSELPQTATNDELLSALSGRSRREVA
jgi:ABC-type sugar transport system ATPase subunit